MLLLHKPLLGNRGKEQQQGGTWKAGRDEGRGQLAAELASRGVQTQLLIFHKSSYQNPEQPHLSYLLLENEL